MIQKTSMTIDAYLRHAGLKTAGTTGRKQFIPLKTGLNSTFSEISHRRYRRTRQGPSEKKQG
jgi:hypothetical protein